MYKILEIVAVTALSLLLAAPADGLSLNKSIEIAAGSEADGQSSVNGSISVGEGAVINGSLETVNGSIRIDDKVTLRDAETVNGAIRIGSGSTADDLSSVNGAITLASNVVVNGGVETVNGEITVDEGTRVTDGVGNVNGDISLVGADVGGNLSTVNGDVSLDRGSILRGNLVVEQQNPGGFGFGKLRRKTRVVIGRDSKVLGTVVLEREVELYLHDSAEVGGVSGVMGLDDAVRFSGDRP
ncbi:MAG: hypothetical protein R3192_17140 [Woeseiaceae bacterium]|nr:hypothetical protein [Woeseiaceae bacterium]